MTKPHLPGAKSAEELVLEEEQRIVNYSVDSYVQDTPYSQDFNPNASASASKRSWRESYLAIKVCYRTKWHNNIGEFTINNKGLLPFMIPLFFVYLFEYSILQGINSSIVFSNMTKCPYTTYQFL